MRINDLTDRDPIVDPQTGRPSQHFMRLLMDRGGLQQSAQDTLDQVLTLNVIAGDGLDGGGTVQAALDANPDAPVIEIDANASAILDLISTTHGAVLYRDSAAWAALTPGADGDVLTTHGAAADPTWETPTGGSGSAAWTLVDQTGAPTTGSTWTWSTNVTSVSVTGLGSYNELLVIARGLTVASTGQRNIVVSTDGGSTYRSTSGDYVGVSLAGAESNTTIGAIHDTNATAARTLIAEFRNLKGAAKHIRSNHTPGDLLFVQSTSDINAIELRGVIGGGVNITAGTLHVYAR